VDCEDLFVFVDPPDCSNATLADQDPDCTFNSTGGTSNHTITCPPPLLFDPKSDGLDTELAEVKRKRISLILFSHPSLEGPLHEVSLSCLE